MPRNRRFATVEKSYITDIERERCKKVAAAYAELYVPEDIPEEWRQVEYCDAGGAGRDLGRGGLRREHGEQGGG